MKIKFKKIMSVILASVLATGMLVGCGSKPSKDEDKNSSGNDTPRVAVILQGPISDMAWNATAYNGIKKIEELGAEISYQENVAVSSLADSMRTYATEGFDLIFLSTNSYEDIAKTTAPSFPDTEFIQINGTETNGNLVALQIADEEQGYLMGVVSALATEKNSVGFIGGEEITPIINGKKGFIQGVEHINKDIKVNAQLTGNMDNVNQAKEMAKSMIESGCDVISPMCDQSSIGVLEAAEEIEGTKSVCSGVDQQSSATKAGLVAVGKDTSIAYVAAYQKWLNGELGTGVLKMGAADGVIFLTDWFTKGNEMPADLRNGVNAVYENLKSGNIVIDLA